MIEQSGIRKSFYTGWGDAGLFARVIIEDNTTGTPVLVTALPMSEVRLGIYLASFVPSPGIAYLFTAQVYTDNTFAVVDQNYGASTGDFSAVAFSSIGAESGVMLDDSEIEAESGIMLDDDEEQNELTGEDC